MNYLTWLGIPFGFLVVLIIWDAVWKLIALWKSARNNDLVWFIVMAILNTAGILPIIYIFLFSEKKAVKKVSEVHKPKTAIKKKIVRKKK